MKKNIALLTVSLLLICCSAPEQDDFPVFSGPYLGQKPPGMTPKIFAPGIISTRYSEVKAVFTLDGKELFYQLWGAPFPVILTTKEVAGHWTKPRIASFSGQTIEGYNITPDGKKMFITSNRPLDGIGKPLKKSHIWVSEKSKEGWGEINPLKGSIHGYPTIAANGTLYLATGDLWISRFENGEYTKMVKLPDTINTEAYEEDPFIAPDESYIMFCRREGGFGGWDIYISFQKKDGSWTKAINMGDQINSKHTEIYPFVSLDGKYFFFCSSRTTQERYSLEPLTYERKLKIMNQPGNGRGDIYWVDAKFIETLKPNNLR